MISPFILTLLGWPQLELPYSITLRQEYNLITINRNVENYTKYKKMISPNRVQCVLINSRWFKNVLYSGGCIHDLQVKHTNQMVLFYYHNQIPLKSWREYKWNMSVCGPCIYICKHVTKRGIGKQNYSLD